MTETKRPVWQRDPANTPEVAIIQVAAQFVLRAYENVTTVNLDMLLEDYKKAYKEVTIATAGYRRQ